MPSSANPELPSNRERVRHLIFRFFQLARAQNVPLVAHKEKGSSAPTVPGVRARSSGRSVRAWRRRTTTTTRTSPRRP